MKYIMQNLNVVKTVESDNERDRLIAKGFTLIAVDKTKEKPAKSKE